MKKQNILLHINDIDGHDDHIVALMLRGEEYAVEEGLMWWVRQKLRVTTYEEAKRRFDEITADVILNHL